MTPSSALNHNQQHCRRLYLPSVVPEPGENDVLCGRGVPTSKYAGNQKFRELVAQHKDVYVTSTKKGKMTISRSIVRIVREDWNPAGRFLEKDSSTQLWRDIGDKKAIEKTSQALRDAASKKREQYLKSGVCLPLQTPALIGGSIEGNLRGSGDPPPCNRISPNILSPNILSNASIEARSCVSTETSVASADNGSTTNPDEKICKHEHSSLQQVESLEHEPHKRAIKECSPSPPENETYLKKWKQEDIVVSELLLKLGDGDKTRKT